MINTAERKCGGCTACCKTHPVIEIFKPAHEWCLRCDRGKGCRIYQDRPGGCVGFKCQWLLGEGSEDDRPDRTRIVADYFETEEFGWLVMLYETIPGALQNSFAQRRTRESLRRGSVVCHLPIYGSNRIFVPSNVHVPDIPININGRDSVILPAYLALPILL